MTTHQRMLASLVPWTLLVSASLPAVAQERPEVAALDQRVTTFFQALADRTNIREAVDQLIQGGPLERNNNTDNLVQQADQFSARYGRFLESERVAMRSAGEDLILLTYLYKTERFPVVWRVAFYRRPDSNSNGEWRVVSLSFDTNYKLLELLLVDGTEGNSP